MEVKLNVKTPKGQAAKCIESQKNILVGITRKDRIIKQEIVNDGEFYWILNLKDRSEIEEITMRMAKGEVMIKQFYSTLFKWIHRANKLCAKFGKATTWIKKWILKQLNKQAQAGTKDNGLKKEIEGMKDEEFTEFIKFNDIETMKEFLNQELMSIEILTE